jgi:DNA end-binding protein Ku
MPRSLWSGALSFGLVNVQVALYSAVRDLDVHFHQLHGKDGARIETRRFCVEEDREVPYEEIGRGYDLEDGRTVILTDEELAAAAPRRTRTIDIEAFVDLDDVDPILFDHPYFLGPTGETEGNLRAYRLLVEVLRSTDRAALGRFVLRTKEYLVLVRVRDDRLALTTMLFHDEVRPTEGIPAGGRKPAKAELEAAVGLVTALSTDWDPARYRDRFRERLLEIIRRKERHEVITAPRPAAEEQGAPADIMAVLRASLERARTGGGGDGGDGGPRFTRDDAGSREAEDLEDLSREELYERAKEADVPGRSKMSKEELVEALADRG